MNVNQDISASVSPRIICKNCKGTEIQIHSPVDNIQVDYASIANENKCLNWLERCSLTSDSSSVCSSEISSETTDSQSTKDDKHQSKSLVLDDSENDIAERQNLRQLKSEQYQGNVQLSSCTDVVVGRVTNIRGPIYITQTNSIVNKQSIQNNIFLEGTAVTTPRKLYIANRRIWLAQPPLAEKEYLSQSAKYVIISHTATEDGITQSDNVELIRIIQTYHIESKKWDDIGYNFLVGCDGNVYEGRGWGVVGSHTFGYNNVSVGIAFVGCFMNKLPPKSALNQAKALIKQGVEIGAIDKNYYLVGHCQCRPFESPGRQLYDELKTWDNWCDIEALPSV